MKLLLVAGTATLLGGAHFAHGQSPSALGLHLFAGVEITGTAGGVYAVQSTANLEQTNSWATVAFVQLTSTEMLYVDTSAPVAGSRLYRAMQITPTNMVFIPPDTFRMGSLTNELDRQANEGPQTTSITNYAWQSFDGGLTVHPVGQKLPNPWGLYDIMGNVFEWCQDWLGPLPGGFVSDPQGPPSNEIGWKVMRGGAFDFGPSSCRSASRNFFGNHPALTDWNLGFRVVLVCEP